MDISAPSPFGEGRGEAYHATFITFGIMHAIHTTIPSAILHTERLLLKELTPGVMNLVYTTLNDEQVKLFMGYLSDDELQAEQQKFQQGLTMHNRSFRNFLLIDKEDGNVTGKCGFHTWYKQHSRAEIGYAMAANAVMGKGYMKEAMKPILDYGFDTMQLNRVEAFIGKHNAASLKLVQGFGFEQEGVLRGHYCKNGVIEDSVCFGLLRQDYSGINILK